MSGHPPTKPMEIFGAAWKDHWNRIQDDWRSRVKEEDTVLVAGDISWAMHLEDAMVDLDEVREHILGVDHVVDVHDLHVSLISSDLPVLTAHVVVDDECFTDGHAARMLPQLQACVAGHFPISIEHSTFQIETQLNAAQEHVAHG